MVLITSNPSKLLNLSTVIIPLSAVNTSESALKLVSVDTGKNLLGIIGICSVVVFINSRSLKSVSKFVTILLILYTLLNITSLSASVKFCKIDTGRYAFTFVNLLLLSNTSSI